MNGALQLFALVLASGLVGAGITFAILRNRAKRAAIHLPGLSRKKAEPGSQEDAQMRLIAFQALPMNLSGEERLKQARDLYDFLVANEIALPRCMRDEASNVTPFTPRPVA